MMQSKGQARRAVAAMVFGAALLAAGCSSSKTSPDSGSTGGCTPACSANATCTNGACACDSNYTACVSDAGTQCLALASDDLNCGACGHACPGSEVCLNGVCNCLSSTCPLADGGSVCTDFSSDPQNCSACGNVCPTNQSCVGNFCECASPFAACSLSDGGSACVDIGTDSANCGGCGVSCGPGQACAPTAPGAPGACGCQGGSLLCDGGCVDIDTDVNNCGGCNQLCATGLCSAGHCDCSDAGGSFQECGASCTDLQTDVHNCGACASDCTILGVGLNDVSCVDGSCHCVIAIDAGTSNGPGSICTTPATSCVDLSVAANHCGTCGNDCTSQPETTACVNGECACPNGAQLCSGTCEALDSDPTNCGGCQVACDSVYATSASCHGGHCTCLDTETLCLNTAASGKPDPTNPTCACDDNTTSPCTQPTLTFDADVYPLLSSTTKPLGCSASGCHSGGAAAGGLDFSSEAAAWQGLVAGDGGLYGTCDGGTLATGAGSSGHIPSVACACTARVVPGNPTSSLLIQQISGSLNLCGNAKQMPIDQDGGVHALSPCEQQQLSIWVQQGAVRN